MEKLELKHLVPYLLAGVKVYDSYDDKVCELVGVVNGHEEEVFIKSIAIRQRRIDEIKPILRPVSDLNEECFKDGEPWNACDEFEYGDDSQDEVYKNASRDLEAIGKYNIVHDMQFQPFGVVEKLISWKFDVFGLIDKGLAIDVNTIDKKLY